MLRFCHDRRFWSFFSTSLPRFLVFFPQISSDPMYNVPSQLHLLDIVRYQLFLLCVVFYRNDCYDVECDLLAIAKFLVLFYVSIILYRCFVGRYAQVQ